MQTSSFKLPGLKRSSAIAFVACAAAFGPSTGEARAEGLFSGALFEFSGGPSLSRHNVLSKAPRIGVDNNSKAMDLYSSGDFAGALRLWKAEAEEGDIYAQWKLAQMYQFGQGVEIDEGMAWKYYSAVAKKFDGDRAQALRFGITVDATFWFAYYLSQGIPEAGLKKKERHAFNYLKRSANNGHGAAQYEVGRHYLNGIVVRRNTKTGKRWLILSASKRHAPAMALLGTIYWEGKIAQKNRVTGLMWFTLAKQYACPSINPEIFDQFEELYIEASPEERSKAEAIAYRWNEDNPAKEGQSFYRVADCT